MSTRDIERLGNTSPLEYRSTAAGKPAIIQGFAAVFNSPSQPLGNQGVVETVASSLFNKQKGDNDFRNVIAKYDHRSDFLLGSKAARNLELEIHGGGLWYAVHINTETRSGADVYEWVKSKIVTGSSFSFVAYDDRWDWKNGRPERTLLSGKTNDLGPHRRQPTRPVLFQRCARWRARWTRRWTRYSLITKTALWKGISFAPTTVDRYQHRSTWHSAAMTRQAVILISSAGDLSCTPN